jgi:hypothetical protein
MNMNDFDRKFNAIWKLGVAMVVGTALVGLALLAGVVVVVYLLLAHFGVI